MFQLKVETWIISTEAVLVYSLLQILRKFLFFGEFSKKKLSKLSGILEEIYGVVRSW